METIHKHEVARAGHRRLATGVSGGDSNTTQACSADRPAAWLLSLPAPPPEACCLHVPEAFATRCSGPAALILSVPRSAALPLSPMQASEPGGMQSVASTHRRSAARHRTCSRPADYRWHALASSRAVASVHPQHAACRQRVPSAYFVVVGARQLPAACHQCRLEDCPLSPTCAGAQPPVASACRDL